jgi:hypothetical protein
MAMDHIREKSHELRINILRSIINPKHAMGARVGVRCGYSRRD